MQIYYSPSKGYHRATYTHAGKLYASYGSTHWQAFRNLLGILLNEGIVSIIN